jgi:hypothetical protein
VSHWRLAPSYVMFNLWLYKEYCNESSHISHFTNVRKQLSNKFLGMELLSKG